MFRAKILPRPQAQSSLSPKLALKSFTIFFTVLLAQIACFQKTTKVIKGRSALGLCRGLRPGSN